MKTEISVMFVAAMLVSGAAGAADDELGQSDDPLAMIAQIALLEQWESLGKSDSRIGYGLCAQKNFPTYCNPGG